MVLAPVMQVVLTISMAMMTDTLARPTAHRISAPAQRAKAAAAVAVSFQRRRF